MSRETRMGDPFDVSHLFPNGHSLTLIESLHWALVQADRAGPPQECESGWSPVGINHWWQRWNDACRVLRDNGGPDLAAALGKEPDQTNNERVDG